MISGVQNHGIGKYCSEDDARVVIKKKKRKERNRVEICQISSERPTVNCADQAPDLHPSIHPWVGYNEALGGGTYNMC